MLILQSAIALELPRARQIGLIKETNEQNLALWIVVVAGAVEERLAGDGMLKVRLRQSSIATFRQPLRIGIHHVKGEQPVGMQQSPHFR